MPLTQFRRTRTADDDLRQVQDAVGFVFQDILSKEILDGRIIKDIFVSGPTVIEHGLQRKMQGYILVKKNADENVWDSVTLTPARTFLLNSSGDVTVTIWVF